MKSNCETKERYKQSYKKRKNTAQKICHEHKPKICQSCGFKENPTAVHYHHRSPQEKLFSIATQGWKYSAANLKKELNKCDVLCANCHRLHHGYTEGSLPRSCSTHSVNQRSCSSCNPFRQSWLRQKLKTEIVSLFNGECNFCKRSYPVFIFDFHHIDASSKSISIANGIAASNLQLIKNEIDKVVLLCANCHAGVEAGINIVQELTIVSKDSFYSEIMLPRKNLLKEAVKKTEEKKQCSCGSAKSSTAAHCQQCNNRYREKIIWPSQKELKRLVWSMPMTKVAKELSLTSNSSISDVAVRKRCLKLGIQLPPTGFWLRS